MHKMTHQKVKAKDKWGAIPMIPETIDKVLTIIEASDFKQKYELKNIVSGWQKGEFDNIVEDHNYLWGLQRGTIGQAYGTLNKTEEETFIINNFGDKFAEK